MVNVILVFFHLLFIGYIMVKKYKEESISSAFLNFTLIVILFTIGYAIFDSLSKLVVSEQGFGEGFGRDTIVLVLLTITEALFYKIYYFNKPKTSEDGKEK